MSILCAVRSHIVKRPLVISPGREAKRLASNAFYCQSKLPWCGVHHRILVEYACLTLFGAHNSCVAFQ